MGIEDVEALTEPVDEGNDQEAAEGAEAEPVTEGDLEDAPEVVLMGMTYRMSSSRMDRILPRRLSRRKKTNKCH